MKKLYGCVFAMAMAMTANATDYYLIGGFNNWTLKGEGCLFTEADGGNYVLDYQGTLTSDFKINDGTWGNADANFGGSKTLVLDELYQLEVGGSSGNIKLKENVTDPHIVFNPTEKTLLITGAASEAENIYGIHGDIFSGTWETKDMTLTKGKWMLTGVEAQAGNFGIKQMDKASGSQTGWISADGDGVVTVGLEMPCKFEGVNFSVTAGTYDITFDPEAMTLLVASVGVNPDPTPDPDPDPTPGGSGVYLRGDMNGWAADTEWEFSTADNVIYTLEHKSVEDYVQFKVAGADWETVNYGGPFSIFLGYSEILEFGSENLMLVEGGDDLTFTFNMETKELVVTDPTHPVIDATNVSYAVKGNIFGDPDWSMEVMTLTDGKWVLADKEINEGYFGIAVVNQDMEQLPGTPGWYSWTYPEDDNVGAEVLLNEPMKMGIYGFSMKIDAGTYTFIFDKETMELIITDVNTRVDAIEALEGEAVYYNLQGVRVANPATGMYIKVADGKVSKVVVK